MTVSRDKDRNVIFECDECGDQIGGWTTDFQIAKEEVHEHGWSYDWSTKEHNCGCSREIPQNDLYGEFR